MTMTKKTIDHVKDHFNEHPYSRDRWETHTQSSANLVDWLNDKNANLIIDCGCGTNPYKGKVKNLIGIDAADYPEADISGMGVEEVYEAGIFKDGCADVVMALGSINFGSWEDVYNMIYKLTRWCKSGGTIVLRARLADQTFLGSPKPYDQYQWQMEDIRKMTREIGDVEMVCEPLMEQAAGGNKESHGSPDLDRSINLAVWYWRKK